MKRSRFTEEQTIEILREQASGQRMCVGSRGSAAPCLQAEVEDRGRDVPEARRLKELLV